MNFMIAMDLNGNERKIIHLRSEGSSVNIVSDYGLDVQGSIPDIDRGFFF
jgi:hypothetical protein